MERCSICDVILTRDDADDICTKCEDIIALDLTLDLVFELRDINI